MKFKCTSHHIVVMAYLCSSICQKFVDMRSSTCNFHELGDSMSPNTLPNVPRLCCLGVIGLNIASGFAGLPLTLLPDSIPLIPMMISLNFRKVAP
jgi:hypothetical protein